MSTKILIDGNFLGYPYPNHLVFIMPLWQPIYDSVLIVYSAYCDNFHKLSLTPLVKPQAIGSQLVQPHPTWACPRQIEAVNPETNYPGFFVLYNYSVTFYVLFQFFSFQLSDRKTLNVDFCDVSEIFSQGLVLWTLILNFLISSCYIPHLLTLLWLVNKFCYWIHHKELYNPIIWAFWAIWCI